MSLCTCFTLIKNGIKFFDYVRLLCHAPGRVCANKYLLLGHDAALRWLLESDVRQCLVVGHYGRLNTDSLPWRVHLTYAYRRRKYLRLIWPEESHGGQVWPWKWRLRSLSSVNSDTNLRLVQGYPGFLWWDYSDRPSAQHRWDVTSSGRQLRELIILSAIQCSRHGKWQLALPRLKIENWPDLGLHRLIVAASICWCNYVLGRCRQQSVKFSRWKQDSGPKAFLEFVHSRCTNSFV